MAKLTADVIGGLQPEQRTDLDGQTVLVVGNRGEGGDFSARLFQVLDVERQPWAVRRLGMNMAKLKPWYNVVKPART